jgi:CHAT domain-containing protein
LIKDYAISYSYSNKSLFSPNRPWTERVKEYLNPFAPHYVGFGLTYDDATLEAVEKKIGGASGNIQKKQLLRLEKAAEHIKGVATLLGGDAVTDEQASLQNFKQKAPEADILHLHTHTIYDDKNPLNTSIVFNKDTTANFLLVTPDIYRMQFHAGLVVLSMCNSGLGEIKRGEGIMSLARAFSFANCKSLILTLWPIPEGQTTEVLDGFYINLRAGQPKDIALQQAKIAYLTQKGTSEEGKPNFWAANICLDNIDALYLTRGQKCLRLGILMTCLFGLSKVIYLTLSKKKDKKKNRGDDGIEAF